MRDIFTIMPYGKRIPLRRRKGSPHLNDALLSPKVRNVEHWFRATCGSRGDTCNKPSWRLIAGVAKHVAQLEPPSQYSDPSGPSLSQCLAIAYDRQFARSATNIVCIYAFIYEKAAKKPNPLSFCTMPDTTTLNIKCIVRRIRGKAIGLWPKSDTQQAMRYATPTRWSGVGHVHCFTG